jgi:ParB/RepB/Spo0J family partition protein
MPVEAAGILGRNSMFYRVDPRLITVDPGFNVRQHFDEAKQAELVESIRANGVKKPLLARKDGPNIVLTDGHRRLRAVQTLLAEGVDIKWVTVEFEEAHQTEAERLITALASNDGVPLTPLEEAEGFKRLVRWGWTHQQIAQRVGKSVSFVTHALNLLQAGPELTAAIVAGDIKPTKAIEIIREARNGSVPQEKLLTQHKVADVVPATKEEKTLKAFTKSLDKIGIGEAIQAFLDYAKKEELEYLIEGFTLALHEHTTHNVLADIGIAHLLYPKTAVKRGYIGDDDE